MLQSLNVQNNNIKEIPKILCPNLRILDASDNHINSIAEDFEGHERLVELDLNANSIAHMEKLGNMPELRTLRLSNNKIKELVGLEGCASLEFLDLRANNVRNRPV